jgi:hypothetical protein
MSQPTLRESVEVTCILTIGFGLTGLLCGFAAWSYAWDKPMRLLIGAAIGAVFGAFIGVWGSCEPDER